jgi:Cu+-exporting ATPase
MKVEESNAAGKAAFDGETYYFCSEDCKRKFEQNPQKYAGKAA